MGSKLGQIPREVLDAIGIVIHLQSTNLEWVCMGMYLVKKKGKIGR